jgi:hypothetical protein
MINVTIKFLPKALNAADAAEYIGAPQLFADMRAHGWIKPLCDRHRMTMFDREELDNCYARFYAGEYPGKRSSQDGTVICPAGRQWLRAPGGTG